MSIIDLSYELNNKILEYPEDLKFKLTLNDEIDDCIVSNIETCLHNGTHMDAPFHYINNGKKITDFKLEDFIGKSSIIKTSEHEIYAKEYMDFEDIVIIITNWSKYWGSKKYFYSYPTISYEFAQRLVKNNIKGIAIDTCSVDKHDSDKIHKELLENDIWIVENIANSNRLTKSTYEAYFIPLNIDAEASPVRVFVKDY